MTASGANEAEVVSLALELYALPPSNFVAARNAAAKSLSGDTARAVRALRKPAPSAWLINRLVTAKWDDLNAAIDVGADLRDAQAAGERTETERLDRLRRDLVRGLVTQSAAIGKRDGISVSTAVLDEVTRTITAGLADDDAAHAVRSGLLVRALQSNGFDRVDLDGAVAVGDTGSTRHRRKRPSASAARSAEIQKNERAEAAAAKAAATKRREDLRRSRAETIKGIRQMKIDLAEIESTRDQKRVELATAEVALSQMDAQLDALK